MNGQNIRVNIDSQFSFLIRNSFIGQFVHPEGWEGVWMGKGDIEEKVVLLACCMFHFIREHENLVQYPSNNKSITRSNIPFIDGSIESTGHQLQIIQRPIYTVDLTLQPNISIKFTQVYECIKYTFFFISILLVCNNYLH